MTIGDRYRVIDDPDCIPGTTVLRNLAGIAEQDALDSFEMEAVGLRALEPPPLGDFDADHYRRLHRHLFQDVYEWAGRDRTVQTWKGSSRFCVPGFIRSQMDALFATTASAALQPSAHAETFVPALADFLADLNAIHPFREGNGRAQLLFARLLGLRAGHRFRLDAVEPEPFLLAMIESFHGKNEALVDELERILV